MPIRFTVVGVKYEADTVDEAVRLSRGLEHFRRSGSLGGLAKAVAKVRKSRSSRVFGARGKQVLEVLRGSAEGVTTQALADKLGVSRRSIPPMIAGWKNRARHLGLELDALVERQVTYENGKPVSIYRRTEEGKRHFQEGP